MKNRQSIYNARYAATDKGKESQKRRTAKWLATNRAIVNEKARIRQASPEFKAQRHIADKERYRLLRTDPEYIQKSAARKAVAVALKYGVLHRRPCACGQTKVQAHHVNYPEPLNVIWVCEPCHKRIHFPNVR